MAPPRVFAHLVELENRILCEDEQKINKMSEPFADRLVILYLFLLQNCICAAILKVDGLTVAQVPVLCRN